MRKRICIALFLLLLLGRDQVQAVSIDTVPINNPGNPARVDGGFGSVADSFRIGKFETSNEQYVEFLNAVAASDALGLYNPIMGSASSGGIIRNGSPGSYSYAVKPPALGQGPGGTNYAYGNKPVMLVSWFDAIRFVNWLNNGQGSSDTESGAYTLLGGTPTPSNATTIVRNPGARWFLPSENEWYKAAYYNPATGTYYDYPTSSNTQPNNNLPSSDTGNSANFKNPGYTTGGFNYPLTDVGEYHLSASPYGTYDQGGNVSEWNEAHTGISSTPVRASSWGYGGVYLRYSTRVAYDTYNEDGDVGFRVATVVPEPSSLVFVITATPWMFVLYRICRREI
jgi:sulfatase modifying factor 1